MQTLISRVGCLTICGEKIDDTTVQSPNSALEALCVSTQGEPQVQLARQLMATALNCIVSGGAGDCTGLLIHDAFAECDAACATNGDPDAVAACIMLLDCFNNGGEWLGDFCQTGTCANGDECNATTPCADLSPCTPLADSCAALPLPGKCRDERKCPASSAMACNDATKSTCAIVGPRESTCNCGPGKLKCPTPEVCAQTSCPQPVCP